MTISDTWTKPFCIENKTHDTLRSNTQDNITGVLDNISDLLRPLWEDDQYKASTIVESRLKKLNSINRHIE